MPKERIRVFLSFSTEQMDAMLSLANQGLLSTAVPMDQLWNKHRMSWIEVRRLEVELGFFLRLETCRLKALCSSIYYKKDEE